MITFKQLIVLVLGVLLSGAASADKILEVQETKTSVSVAQLSCAILAATRDGMSLEDRVVKSSKTLLQTSVPESNLFSKQNDDAPELINKLIHSQVQALRCNLDLIDRVAEVAFSHFTYLFDVPTKITRRLSGPYSDGTFGACTFRCVEDVELNIGQAAVGKDLILKGSALGQEVKKFGRECE